MNEGEQVKSCQNHSNSKTTFYSKVFLLPWLPLSSMGLLQKNLGISLTLLSGVLVRQYFPVSQETHSLSLALSLYLSITVCGKLPFYWEVKDTEDVKL